MAEYFPFDVNFKSYSGSFSGSFQGDGSRLINVKSSNISGSVISASYATTASYLLGSITSASFSSTASYVNPLNQNVIITGSIYIPDSTNSIYFSGSGAASRLVWNDTDGTLDLGLKGGNVTLQIGQGSVIQVVNKTGANLLEADYKAVRVRRVDEGGAQGQRLAIVLAQANNDANSVDTLGLVTEDIAVNQEGFITNSGLVRNIDTTGTLQGETWVDGDVLYLSPTISGSITKVKPQAPQHTIVMGYVVYAHANNGKIFVKVDNGYELDELHNVRITTASLSSGDLLVYSSSVWVNAKQLTGSYGLTGSLQATSFTGSLLGTSSFTTSASYAAQAGNASTIDINVFGSPVDSYLLMSNVAGTTGVAIGGDADLRYNSSTNVLTVPNISSTTFTASNATISGNVTVLGTASINTLVINQIGYSSGSNQLGDAPNDTQTLYGSVVIPTGSLTVTGSTIISSSNATQLLVGANSLFVSRSGRVGIGTSNPAYPFHVQHIGTSGVTGSLVFANQDNSYTGLSVLSNGLGFSLSAHAGGNGYISANNSLNYTAYNSTSPTSVWLGNGSRFRVSNTAETETYLTIATNGNILVNTTVDSGARLHISGSTSQALLVASSSTGPALYVSGSGTVGIGNTGVVNTALAITANGVGGGNYIVQGYDSGAVNRFLVTATGRLQMTGTTDTGTSGTDERVRLTNTFNPTSGTREHYGIYLVQAISQSGGANGITRGLYIQPTLTAATDYRAIETTSGSILFSHGSSTLLFASSSGRIGIGTTTPSHILQVIGTSRLANILVGSLGNNVINNTNNDTNININSGVSIAGASIVSPLARLHVQGSGATSATTTFRTENTNTSASLEVYDSNTKIDIYRGANGTTGYDGIFVYGPFTTQFGANTSNKGIITFLQQELSSSVYSGIQASHINYGNVRAGVYFVGANSIRFVAGSTVSPNDKNMFFSSNGNFTVGGLTDAGFRLDVSGSARITDGLTVTGSQFIFASASSVEFRATGTGVSLGNIITDIHTVTGSLNVSGSITSSLFGTASYATVAQTLLGSVTSASFASTASSVNSLNQNVLITGSLTVGSSSLGPSENTITLGPRDFGSEGGQIGFNAPGGTYTSASMIDLYQNRLRILKGTNAGSTAEVAWWSMNNLQMALPGYNSATAFTGSEVAALGVDSSGNILTTTVPGAILTNNYVGTGFTNPIVTYMPFGTTTVSGNESQRQVASPIAGTIKNFYLRTNNTAPATSYTTWTVRINGVATGITLVISGGQAAGLYSNTINSASVTVGAEISLQVSTSVANSSQVNQYSLGIYPS